MFLVENKVSTELSPVSRVNTTKLNQTVTEILFKENIKQKRKKKKERITNLFQFTLKYLELTETMTFIIKTNKLYSLETRL